MAHTPGPWRYDKFHCTILSGEDKENEDGELVKLATRVVDCYGALGGDDTDADVRLIVAAPELLAALKAVASTYRTFRNVPKEKQEWTPLDDEALEAAFAAISKAEGE
jgi:hypothetical protein